MSMPARWPFPFVPPEPRGGPSLVTDGTREPLFLDEKFRRPQQLYAMFVNAPSEHQQARIREMVPAPVRPEEVRFAGELLYLNRAIEIDSFDFVLANSQPDVLASLDQMRAAAEREYEPIDRVDGFAELALAAAPAWDRALVTWMRAIHEVCPVACASGRNPDGDWATWSERAASIDMLAPLIAFVRSRPELRDDAHRAHGGPRSDDQHITRRDRLDQIIPCCALPILARVVRRSEHREPAAIAVRQHILELAAAMIHFADTFKHLEESAWVVRAALQDLPLPEQRVTLERLDPYVQLAYHASLHDNAPGRILLQYEAPIARVRTLLDRIPGAYDHDVFHLLRRLAYGLAGCDQFFRAVKAAPRHPALAGEVMSLVLDRMSGTGCHDEHLHAAGYFADADEPARVLEVYARLPTPSGSWAGPTAIALQAMAARAADAIGRPALAGDLRAQNIELRLRDDHTLHGTVGYLVASRKFADARAWLERRGQLGPLTPALYADWLDSYRDAPRDGAGVLDELLRFQHTGTDFTGPQAASRRKRLLADPDVFYRMVVRLLQLDRREDARATLTSHRTAREPGADPRYYFWPWIAIARATGDTAECALAADGIRRYHARDGIGFLRLPATHFHMACLDAAAGRSDEAMVWLQHARTASDFVRGAPESYYFDFAAALRADPALASLRGLDAFAALTR